MTAPVYATINDLTEYLGELTASESDLQRKLYRASRAIDSVLIGTVYKIDDESQFATDDKIRDAIKMATIEQVDGYLSGVIAESGTSAYDSVSIGSVKLSGSAKGDEGRKPFIAPQALSQLEQAGLLPLSVTSYG